MPLESGGAVSAVFGQGDPELQRVERDGSVADGVLRVGDALAARHEVEGPRTHHDVAAHGIPVPHLPDDRPRHRLQPDVRVGLDAHESLLRPEPVEEAPRAHQRQRAMGERAVHFHAADTAERNLPGLDDEGARSVAFDGAFGLRRSDVEARHAGSPGSADSAASSSFCHSMTSPGTSFSRR